MDLIKKTCPAQANNQAKISEQNKIKKIQNLRPIDENIKDEDKIKAFNDRKEDEPLLMGFFERSALKYFLEDD